MIFLLYYFILSLYSCSLNRRVVISKISQCSKWKQHLKLSTGYALCSVSSCNPTLKLFFHQTVAISVMFYKPFDILPWNNIDSLSPRFQTVNWYSYICFSWTNFDMKLLVHSEFIHIEITKVDRYLLYDYSVYTFLPLHDLQTSYSLSFCYFLMSLFYL